MATAPPPSPAAEALAELRRDLDRLDDELLEMLGRRAALALEAGRLKKELRRPVRDPGREKEVLDRLAAAAPPPLTAETVRPIFEAVIRACRKIQEL